MKERKHPIATYVSKEVKDLIVKLADEWKCSNSQVLERLITNSKELKAIK